LAAKPLSGLVTGLRPVVHVRELLIEIPRRLTARARMLEGDAPETCRAVWGVLPVRSRLIHAAYSGEEVFLELPRLLDVRPENQTIYLIPGDVFYWQTRETQYMSVKKPVAEIAFAYGRQIEVRSGHSGRAAVNVFATIADGLERFAEVAADMRRKTGPLDVVVRGRERRGH